MKMLEQDIDNLLIQLIEKYDRDKRYILTESDLVNRFYSMIQNSEILTKHNLILHSELRPFDGKNVIHKEKWGRAAQINYAAQFDLALIDPDEKYWREALEKVRKSQTKQGKKEGIQYWRILSYPLAAHKAVFEFKIRAKGNTTKINKDIKKLGLIHQKNKYCLTYLILLDRKAPKTTIKNIKAKLEYYRHIRFYTHPH